MRVLDGWELIFRPKRHLLPPLGQQLNDGGRPGHGLNDELAAFTVDRHTIPGNSNSTGIRAAWLRLLRNRRASLGLDGVESMALTSLCICQIAYGFGEWWRQASWLASAQSPAAGTAAWADLDNWRRSWRDRGRVRRQPPVQLHRFLSETQMVRTNHFCCAVPTPSCSAHNVMNSGSFDWGRESLSALSCELASGGRARRLTVGPAA